MLIGVDVDLTLVPTDGAWWNWMEAMYRVNGDFTLPEEHPKNGRLFYDLGKYFPEPGKHMLKPKDFWEDPYLYDRLRPYGHAMDVLKKWVKQGHQIAFISMCHKGHQASKVRFLKRWTQDFMDLDDHSQGHGFYATHFKGNINCDVMIDDRNEFFNQFDPAKTILIKMKTPYEQFYELTNLVDCLADDWYDIEDFMDTILE